MSSRNSETRTKILAATCELLEAGRGKNVRMGDIAKAAGVSRQAVYLHFPSRTELMVAAVQYGDEIRNASSQVQPWRDAQGVDKLDAWIHFWGHYVPQIYGVAKALMIARETDDAAAAAWDDRMKVVRNDCRLTIRELKQAGLLRDDWTIETATDILWTLLSIPAWEQLTTQCRWSTKRYVQHMQTAARLMLLHPDTSNVHA